MSGASKFHAELPMKSATAVVTATQNSLVRKNGFVSSPRPQGSKKRARQAGGSRRAARVDEEGAVFPDSTAFLLCTTEWDGRVISRRRRGSTIPEGPNVGFASMGEAHKLSWQEQIRLARE